MQFRRLLASGLAVTLALSVGLVIGVSGPVWAADTGTVGNAAVSRVLAHGHEVIARYSKGSGVPIFYQDGFIYFLVKEGYILEAENLLKDAVARVEEVSGPQGRESCSQLLILVDFYLGQKEASKALAVLDQLLTLNPEAELAPACRQLRSHCNCSGFCDIGEVLGQLRRLALNLISGKYAKTPVLTSSRIVAGRIGESGREFEDVTVCADDLKLGLVILGKVLARQKMVLGAHDERLVATYVSVAEAYAMAKNYKLARANYEAALRIAKLYEPGEQAVFELGTGYKYVLNKLGDKQEVKKLAGPVPSFGHNCGGELKLLSDTQLAYLRDVDAKEQAIFTVIGRKDFLRSEELIRELEALYKCKVAERANDATTKKKSYVARLESRYLAIARRYCENGNLDLSRFYLLKCVDAAANTVASECSYDQPLAFAVVNAYLKAGKYDESANLMYRLVRRLNRVVNLEPMYRIDADFKLSEVLIEQSRHKQNKGEVARLKAQAQNIFESALASLKRYALPDSGQVERAVAMHNLHLAKPALAALALDGLIEFHGEKPGAVDSSVLNGKHHIYISGQFGFQVSGQADGTLLVLVNGKRLVTLAENYLCAGNLSQSYNSVLAGLRANPDSQGFAVLGEYWYIQGEYTKALQACDESLELDSKNYYALGVRALVHAKLGNRQQAEKDARAVLDGLKTVTTPTDRLAQAFAHMVLLDFDKAIAAFSELNEPKSKSWRALFFRQQCYEAFGKKDLAAADANLLKQWQGKSEKATN